MPLSRVLEPELMVSADEASEYDEMDFSVTDRLFAERAAALATGAGSKPTWIIDLGSGNAKIPLMMAPLVPASARICAVEMSAEMLAIAKTNRRRVESGPRRLQLLTADAKRLPLPDASVDLVTSNSLIHHIPEPGSVFREIARISRPGGGILIRDLIRPACENDLSVLVATHAGTWSSSQRRLFSDSLHAALTLDEVRRYLNECALADVRVTRITDRHWSAERGKPLLKCMEKIQPIPLRIGTDAEFAILRSALETAGYIEPALCSRLGIQKITQFDLEIDRTRNPVPSDEPLALLIHLLLEGGSLPRSQTARLPIDALAALGLIAPRISDPELLAAAVLLYPMNGLYVVSDRTRPVEGKTSDRPFEDFVYPALIPNTGLFLELVQPGPCRAYLDLCAGTGIAALMAARHGAEHAYAYDITERSTVFAEFNRHLNGLPNLTAARGDLYEPAGDLTFDRIVAHPPYVPVFRKQLIFDSGGQDGEQIIRRIIEGLPRHLRPGGRFYALTMGSDRELPFERRLREWLGSQEADFDVAFVNRRSHTPQDWASDWLVRFKGTVADIAQWRAFFEELQVKELVYGLVMIQRKDKARSVFTVRRQNGSRTGPAEHAWLLDWETRAASLDLDWIFSRHPRAAAGTRLRVEHQMGDRGWSPDTYDLESSYPFSMDMRAQAWTAHLIGCADGVQTSAELFARMKSDGAVDENTPPAEFARLLATLISGGFLTAE